MCITDIEQAKVTVKKIQKIVYAMLCDIDDFCKENNIRYYLSGGTCLGAVRHQGFIPWDDDADLMMPRKDYERFIAIFPDAFASKYGLGAFSSDPKWQRQYARCWDKTTILKSTNLEDVEMGVFIDIFPIDGLPESKIGRGIYYARIKLLSAIGSATVKKDFLAGEHCKIIKIISGTVLRPLGMRFFTLGWKS